MTDRSEGDSGDRPPERPLGLLQVIGSVLAAAFGVQSRENKLRDFSRGKPLHFILAGLILTAGFIAALVLVINLVL